jgi:hypothetical protein
MHWANMGYFGNTDTVNIQEKDYNLDHSNTISYNIGFHHVPVKI